MRITFVCSGNTCRSPLAVAAWQVVLHEMAPACRAQLEPIEVGSAGLNARVGNRANAMAQLVAASWDADLSEHRAQSWEPPLAPDEMLIAMTREQATQLRFRLGFTAAPMPAQITILGEFGAATAAPLWGEPQSKEAQFDIPDPYGGSSEAYEECGARILRNVRALALSLCRE